MAYRTTALRVDRDQLLRARILESGLQRLVDGGFANLTMQTLAETAGIATGSLYRHFRNKGELAAEVFMLASQREVDVLASVLRAPGAPAERMALGIRQFAARAWHSQQLAYALIAEPVEPEVDEQRLRFREAYAEVFAELLEEGVGLGVFRCEAIQLTAACLVGAIAEALVGPLSPQARAARQADHAEVDLDKVCQHLIIFCLRAVVAEEIR